MNLTRLAKSSIIALCCLLTACSTDGNATQDALRLVVPDDPRTLNPILGTSPSDLPLSKLAFDSLLVADEHNNLVGRLASTVPTVVNGGISSNGLRYTFRLRRDVRWQDNYPFSSADVTFTMHAIVNPANAIGNRFGYAEIANVSARDPFTVVFRLKRRFAPFLAVVGAGFPILPAHLLAKSAALAADPFNDRPVGTGPYKLYRWDRGSSLLYIANAHYFLGPPTIQRVNVRIIPDASAQAFAVARHDVDFAGVQSSEYQILRGKPRIRTTTEPRNDFVGIALNTERPLLRDVRVRRALAIAIDSVRITRANTAGTGTVAYADLPPFMWTSRAPVRPYRFDVDRARSLLESAGWRLRADGVRTRNGISLHLDAVDFSGSPTGERVDAQIQQMLKAVGIDVAYRYFPWQLYFAPAASAGTLAGGNYDMADDASSAGIDPGNESLYSCASRSPKGPNIARYCNPKMDRLLQLAVAELDPKHRKRIIASIEELAVTDVPYVFLYYTPKRLAWTAGLRRTPSSLDDFWYGVSRWSFSTQ